MEFTVKNFTYRIKKMNAIELLSLRSVINFKDYESVMKCYNTLLEKVEVRIKDNDYIQVKQGSNFFPADVENDVETIEALVMKVLEYIKSVFQKSSESNY